MRCAVLASHPMRRGILCFLAVIVVAWVASWVDAETRIDGKEAETELLLRRGPARSCLANGVRGVFMAMNTGGGSNAWVFCDGANEILRIATPTPTATPTVTPT